MSWTVRFYKDKETGEEPCREWLDELGETDRPKQLAALAAIERVLKIKGTDVCETEWGKNLGSGLYEFRIRHSLASVQGMFPLPGDWAAGDADTDGGRGTILLRIFFTTYGSHVLLLCSGYDKRRDPSKRRQRAEIAQARKLVERAQVALQARKKVYGA